MIEQRTKAWIETEFKRRVRNIVVRDMEPYQRHGKLVDFSRGFLKRMDAGLYQIEQNRNEIILTWREPRNNE